MTPHGILQRNKGGQYLIGLLLPHLRRETGWDVIVGFSEFCGPSLDEALERTVTLSVEKVIVVTPMMTQGGEHSKTDIPAAIHRAQARHPQVPVLYAWPFDVSDVAQFLAKQISRFYLSIPKGGFIV